MKNARPAIFTSKNPLRGFFDFFPFEEASQCWPVHPSFPPQNRNRYAKPVGLVARFNIDPQAMQLCTKSMTEASPATYVALRSGSKVASD